MNIGEAAKKSGVGAKMIRHYESIGIIPKAGRTDAGYRIYSDADVHTLQFVRHARSLGFSMAELKKLVGLWRNKSRASAEVKALTIRHVASLEKKIDELKQMRDALKAFAKRCQGDERPDCPIIEEIERGCHS